MTISKQLSNFPNIINKFVQWKFEMIDNINTPEFPNTTLLLNNMDRIGISKPLAFRQYQNFNKTQFESPAK